MKTKLTFLLLLTIAFCKGQIVNIPDANFKYYLSSSNCASFNPILIDNNFDYGNYNGANSYTDVDVNNDGQIQLSEAQSVTELKIFSIFNCNPCDMYSSLQGLEAFSNVKILTIYSTSGIETLNIDSILPNLEFIKVFITNSYQNASSIPIRNLKFKNLPSLKFISFVGVFWLENIEISNNSNLLKINYAPTYYNSSQSLNSFLINNLPSLDFLNLKIRLNGSLDLSSLNSQNLECYLGPYPIYTIMYPTVAKKIEIDSYQGNLNFSNMSNLKELKITNYLVSFNTINYGNIGSTLDKLELSTSSLTANTDIFQFNGLTNLKDLKINGGSINSNLLFNNLTSLQILTLNGTRFLNESTLDFSPLTNLADLNITGPNGNVSNHIVLNLNGLNSLNKLWIDCTYQIEDINLSSLTSVNDLKIIGIANNLWNITTINFGNLTNANKIEITGNNHFITINNNLLVTESFKVLYIRPIIYEILIPSTLNFIGQISTPLLQLFGIHPVFTSSNNFIDNLIINTGYDSSNNVFNNLNLSSVRVNKLNITYSTTSGFYNTTTKNIFLSDYTDLKEFNLTSSIINANGNNYHLLREINLNSQRNLSKLNIFMPAGILENLLVKNGKNNYTTVQINANSRLKYICVDDLIEAQQIQNNVIPNLVLNANDYCSFVPGNIFYTIEGNQKMDFNNNGCDVNDLNIPFFKIKVDNGLISTEFITNNDGNYQIQLIQGNYTITPILQNPNYFNVSPTSASVTFPTQTSPLTQNFCITPNGIHHDLEIIIIPVGVARPGFDATYKLIYKNKGNVVESGTVSASYPDAILDFVSSSLPVTTQTYGNLIWNFTNLQPLETREITFTLNVNSPTETPAVNAGTQLNFTAIISSPNLDEEPSDSGFDFKQIVVNSFDPNDKTCLQGTTISQTKIGDYVHYMIRFENTGTFPAQNVVIKDIIDLTKFDINTLVPMKGSHNFETRISDNNKVEFIFENINLPFDDANNDGYIVFKIKTKATLVVGNTFSNSANIYFDYNFPIVTNNYTTTIQNSLGLSENELSKNITIYPNPAKNTVNFETKETILKVEIYDISGRILSSNSVTENKIDVSQLKTGNYILNVITENGIMNSKIIKE